MVVKKGTSIRSRSFTEEPVRVNVVDKRKNSEENQPIREIRMLPLLLTFRGAFFILAAVCSHDAGVLRLDGIPEAPRSLYRKENVNVGHFTGRAWYG